MAKRGIHAALFPEVGFERVKVGRFELVRRLGRGGMGEVFEAYDAQLDRSVALKLLLRERAADQRARDRLLREAQVLARLSHPNVVQIYEAGIHEDQVYLVMELVDGVTLREWMRPEGDDDKAVRPWQEVLTVMVAAGRGLAAAHQAGVTHRDFKPENVLVGHDGRVRVLDFGLARPGSEPESSVGSRDPDSLPGTTFPNPGRRPSGDAPISPSMSSADPLSSRGSGSRRMIAQLTEPGRLLGTLVYMSPEQLATEPLDARSDEFSFCVALYEALYGRRPYAAETYAAYMFAVTQGKITEPEGRVVVPRWLHAAVVRGLEVNPSKRFPDMDSLLHELTRVRGRGWKIGVAAATLLGSVGLAVAATQPEPCAIDRTELAGTWDDERRQALATAFGTLPTPDEVAQSNIERRLDEWSDAWVGSLKGSCEATRVKGTQSEAMFDRRSACLQRVQREARPAIARITNADGTGLGRAFDVLELLPAPMECDDPKLGDTPYPMPTDPQRREAILAAYEQLSQARVLGVSARYEEAGAIAVELEAKAKALDHLPLSIAIRYLDAEQDLWRLRIDDAVPKLRAIIRDAEIARLDDAVASVRTRLALHVVGLWGHPEVQTLALEEADIAVERLGLPDDPRARRLQFARAALINISGDHEGALKAYQEALDQATEQGAALDIAIAEQMLGNVLLDLGRYQEADALYTKAAAAAREAQGQISMIDADIERYRGLMDLDRGEFESARRHLASARKRLDGAVDPNAAIIAVLDTAEAKLALMHGDLDRAETLYLQVIEHGDDLRRAQAWEGLGVIRFYRGDWPGSVDAYRGAKPYYLATLGPEHTSLGILAGNIGESLAASGQHQAALEAFSESLKILERSLPPSSRKLAPSYKGRAKSRLATGDIASARGDLERALLLHVANPGEPVEQADVEFTLAKVSYDSGDTSRAMELAASAEKRLAELGQRDAAEQISAWIEKKTP